MKLGVTYPTREVPGDPDKIRRFVRAAEELGIGYLNQPDHVLSATHADRTPPLNGPYDENDAFDDPFVFFAFVAALSETLEFVTGVLVLPQRQTALVAQQAADVDLLSKERLRLGVGIGWNYVEYQALGQDFKTRSARIEEQIGFLRKLWAEPLVTFEGRFDRIDRAGINPRPKRQIPIYYGGYSEPGYERGAKLCDGFLFAANKEGALHGLDRVRHYLQQYGRDEASFGKELLVMFTKDAAETADTLKAWRDTGAAYGSFPTIERGFGEDIEAHIDYMADVVRQYRAG
jgi:probable F420-dependent oxidoreductase